MPSSHNVAAMQPLNSLVKFLKHSDYVVGSGTATSH